MIPIFKPVFNKEMQEAAIAALNNERFVLGESVFKFEEEFAKYVGTDFAVSTSSGTNALQFSLEVLGARGKEVVTCPASFVATANSVLHAGGKPVFVDTQRRSHNMDPSAIEGRITEKTAAILPVHLYGNPAEMDEINDVAQKRSLPVIEDACQAHGALYKGKKAGSLGTVACFSFYSTKNLTVCGDGGMITTNDEKIAGKLAKIRDCGRISRYEHDELGYTSRLNTVNAAIGRVQLRYLDEWTERRRAIAKRYGEALSGIEGLELPLIEDHAQSAYHLYACMSPRRDALAEHLKKDSIGFAFNFPIPIHLQPLYRRLFGHKEGEFPNAERLSVQVISLPMYPEMTDAEADKVIDSVRRFFS